MVRNLVLMWESRVHVLRVDFCVLSGINLVPRVLRLLGQWVVAWKGLSADPEVRGL